MTPTRRRPKHQGTKGGGLESQTRVKMVRNDRRAQHRVLFRDMRADVPRGPLVDCRLAGDVPRPLREGSTDQRFEGQNRGREAEARATPIRIYGTEPDARLVMQGGSHTPVEATTPGTCCSSVHRQESSREGSCVEGYVMPRAVLDGLDTSSSGPCLGE